MTLPTVRAGALVCLLAAAAAARAAPDAAIVDSDMTLAQALRGSRAPKRVLQRMAILPVRYWSFDGRLHVGQLVVRRDLVGQVAGIFRDIERSRFPVAQAIPVVRFGWSDAASMAANNTSGFNYRRKPWSSALSWHALGAAIDLNPRQNPQVKGRRRLPPGSVYDPRVPGTIVEGPVVRAFVRRGWRWGGHFTRGKDWQHFDRRGPSRR